MATLVIKLTPGTFFWRGGGGGGGGGGRTADTFTS